MEDDAESQTSRPSAGGVNIYFSRLPQSFQYYIIQQSRADFAALANILLPGQGV